MTAIQRTPFIPRGQNPTDFSILRLGIMAQLCRDLQSANPPDVIKAALTLIGEELNVIAGDLLEERHGIGGQN